MFFVSSGDVLFIGDLYEIYVFDTFPRPLRHTGVSAAALITPGIGLIKPDDTTVDITIY